MSNSTSSYFHTWIFFVVFSCILWHLRVKTIIWKNNSVIFWYSNNLCRITYKITFSRSIRSILIKFNKDINWFFFVYKKFVNVPNKTIRSLCKLRSKGHIWSLIILKCRYTWIKEVFNTKVECISISIISNCNTVNISISTKHSITSVWDSFIFCIRNIIISKICRIRRLIKSKSKIS